jgi:hypothetical protein
MNPQHLKKEKNENQKVQDDNPAGALISSGVWVITAHPRIRKRKRKYSRPYDTVFNNSDRFRVSQVTANSVSPGNDPRLTEHFHLAIWHSFFFFSKI